MKTCEQTGRTGGAAVVAALVAVALMLACLCGAIVAPSSARAADGIYDDAAGVEQAKQLIAALPADPDAIGEEQRAAVEAAAGAYDALSEHDRKALDTEVLDKEQSYGRWLESAQWGLEASSEKLDASTDLEDGDYSAFITSVSSMGKSTSERARSWSAVRLVVKRGKFTCVIRCDSQSAFKKMRLAGVEYAARVSRAGVPEFEVPMQVNKNLKFTVDANELADSIAYELEVKLDDSPATAAEVSAAKELVAQGLSGIKANWSSASKRAVRAAADELSRVAGKAGVKHVELQVLQAKLATAQNEARAAAKKTAKRPQKKPSRESKRNQATRGASTASSTSAPRATEVATTSRNDGVGNSPAGSSAKSKKTSAKKKAKAVEVNPGGANTPVAPETSDQVSSAAGGAQTEPNYALLLGLGLVLLLVLGMVLRSLLFTRAMGSNAKEGAK